MFFTSRHLQIVGKSGRRLRKGALPYSLTSSDEQPVFTENDEDDDDDEDDQDDNSMDQGGSGEYEDDSPMNFLQTEMTNGDDEADLENSPEKIPESPKKRPRVRFQDENSEASLEECKCRPLIFFIPKFISIPFCIYFWYTFCSPLMLCAVEIFSFTFFSNISEFLFFHFLFHY